MLDNSIPFVHLVLNKAFRIFFHGFPKQLHQMVAAVITGATSPTPGAKMTTALTSTTLIMIFSSKRWVFKTSQNDSSIKYKESLFADGHFFPS